VTDIQDWGGPWFPLAAFSWLGPLDGPWLPGPALKNPWGTPAAPGALVPREPSALAAPSHLSLFPSKRL